MAAEKKPGVNRCVICLKPIAEGTNICDECRNEWWRQEHPEDCVDQERHEDDD